MSAFEKERISRSRSEMSAYDPKLQSVPQNDRAMSILAISKLAYLPPPRPKRSDKARRRARINHSKPINAWLRRAG
jgi:hypothetical protein